MPAGASTAFDVRTTLRFFCPSGLLSRLPDTTRASFAPATLYRLPMYDTMRTTTMMMKKIPPKPVLRCCVRAGGEDCACESPLAPADGRL